jgi:hypothetical protein
MLCAIFESKFNFPSPASQTAAAVKMHERSRRWPGWRPGVADDRLAGGGSGNPVIFTIDSTTASVCSIKGATVTFNQPGTCVIDANQAGNARYQAAPQVQQMITVDGPE